MTTSTIQTLPLASLHESPTNPRTNWGDLAGLEDSIRAQGFRAEHPLLVRAANDDGYEIVTGHRRARAARAVGLEEVPCVIDNNLDDLAVLEIQLVENAQRADVHPLDEGEAYRRLRDEHHQTIAQIARKVGKSETSVARRLSLTKLIPDGRKALVDEKISLEIAFELSRLPRETMQVEALAIILRPRGEWEGELSAKKVIEQIRAKYFLRLAGARWDLTDATLVPEAGPCSTCSKRTGTQPALFADLAGDDTCIDAECHAKKVDAARALRIDAWKAAGAAFVAQADAKSLFYPYAPHSTTWNGEFIDLDATCEEDPDNGEWWSLIARDVEPAHVTIAIDPSGRARELATKEGAAKALRVAGYAWAKKAERELDASEATNKRKASESKSKSSSKTDAAANKWEEERKTARRIENVILERVAEKAAKLTDEQLLRCAAMANVPMGSGIAERRGLKDASEDGIRKLVAGAKGPALRALVAESIACIELDASDDSFEVDDRSELFKRLAIDPMKIAVEVREAIADEKKGKGPGAKVDAKPPKPATKSTAKAPAKAPAKKAAKAPAKKGGKR